MELRALSAAVAPALPAPSAGLDPADREGREAVPFASFVDADCAQNLGEDGGPVRAFEQSLFVLTTVMSHPVPARACVDAGLKAHSVDSGMPVVHAVAGARFTRASDEHGVHDWFVCFRGDRVEDVRPITARDAFS